MVRVSVEFAGSAVGYPRLEITRFSQKAAFFGYARWALELI
jgi:hypothetical protein